MNITEKFINELSDTLGTIKDGQYIQAQKIEIDNISNFTTVIYELLKNLNTKFYDDNNSYIWNDSLNSGVYFNGSSTLLYDTDIKQTILNKKNQSISAADIDVLIPISKKIQIYDFIQKTNTFWGSSKIASYKQFMDKISVLFYIKVPDDYEVNDFDGSYVQIDFEFADFDSSLNVSEWSKFYNRIHINDASNSIKYKHKNILINAIIKASYNNKNIVLVTKNSEPLNINKKIRQYQQGDLIEQITVNGLKSKFIPLLDKSGNQITIDNKPVFKEVNNFNDIITINQLYELLFLPKNDTSQIQDVEKLYYFEGILSLMKKYLPLSEIQEIFDIYVKDSKRYYNKESFTNTLYLFAGKFDFLMSQIDNIITPRNDVTISESAHIKLGSNSINEDSEPNIIKQMITKAIKTVSDLKILQRVYNLIYSPQLENHVYDVLKTKEFNASQIKDFADKFLMSKIGDLDSKTSLLNLIQVGLIKSNKFTNKSGLYNLSDMIDPDFHRINGFDKFFKFIMNWDTPGENKGKTVGTGENTLRILVNKAFQPTIGDVEIDGKVFEVKATKDINGKKGGKIVATYGSNKPNLPPSIRKKYIKYLIDVLDKYYAKNQNDKKYNNYISIREDLLNDKEPTVLNFVNNTKKKINGFGGLQLWNAIIPNKNIFNKVITELFNNQQFLNYQNADKNQFSSLLNNVMISDKINLSELQKAITKFQLLYYQNQEKFYKFILMNVISANVLIGTAEELFKYVDDGTVVLDGSISFKDSGSHSWRIGIK